ncbi:hypothetical protein ACP0F0_24690, partial [Escherichia coli]|uniref:hypothetical protein n=1 Tax=Escherichia coli TaxID=562 RepID=UPI003CECDBD2
LSFTMFISPRMAFHRRMVGVGQNHQGYYITPIPARIVLRGLLCACSLADSGNTAELGLPA